MTIYAVYVGEWDDTTLCGLFQSKEKAEKYCEIQKQLQLNDGCSYDNYYIEEYEFSDDKVNLDDEVHPYWYSGIYCKDVYNANGELLEKAGVPWTDWMLEELLGDFNEKCVDDLDFTKYDHTKNLTLVELEERYMLPIENMVSKQESFVVCRHEMQDDVELDEIYEILGYSRISIQHARQIALEAYNNYSKGNKVG